jgi:hypothetical protein
MSKLPHMQVSITVPRKAGKDFLIYICITTFYSFGLTLILVTLVPNKILFSYTSFDM